MNSRSATIPMHRQLWILLICALLNSGLWMEALHHHEDFSQDNQDCIFCHAAASPAVQQATLTAPSMVRVVVHVCGVYQSVVTKLSSQILLHSPKTGPPAVFL